MQETRNNIFGSKNVARPFFRRKQLSTSAEMEQQRCCCISALVLNSFRLKKGRATFFRPENIVASFLHSMVLLPKVLLNNSWKRQFVVLHCHIEMVFIQSLLTLETISFREENLILFDRFAGDFQTKWF